MQRTARISINVLFVFTDHDTQLGEIEMRVQALKRIESPFDEIDSFRHRFLALFALQDKPEILSAIFRDHCGHMRPPKSPFVLFPPGHCKGKTNVTIRAILRHYHAAAKTISDHQHWL